MANKHISIDSTGKYRSYSLAGTYARISNSTIDNRAVFCVEEFGKIPNLVIGEQTRIERLSSCAECIGQNCSVQSSPPAVGKIIGLARGTRIYNGPVANHNSGYHTTVPEENWAVKIIGGPRYVMNVAGNEWEWWDTSRKEACDPSGGTGWVPWQISKPVQAATLTPVPTNVPIPSTRVVSPSATPSGAFQKFFKIVVQPPEFADHV